MHTREEAMNKAAENGHLCLAHYAVDTEDEARGMERYFDAKGFSTESSWTKQDRETGELYGWYVNIFWW